MGELVKTWPEAVQFQSKGFKYWECMHQFVPPDKARGINAHHATGSHFFVQSSQVMPMSSQFSSTTTQAHIPPSMPPPVYPSSSQPTTHFQLPSASRPTVQNSSDDVAHHKLPSNTCNIVKSDEGEWGEARKSLFG
ncbi:hypothetical protein PISMIDRAFT_17898 [Pisolithus microcarpus 441]|uniref:Uncharacterized protein n=1 Tax=Pisolithus microcarpus 441 TaxID=765257 RepID=A0A0C9YIH8_9AGAM|nr:hypothetical protein PISMIDRAFT_17898 [Pisolithus microcarpus 441]